MQGNQQTNTKPPIEALVQGEPVQFAQDQLPMPARRPAAQGSLALMNSRTCTTAMQFGGSKIRR